jgi:pyrroloquinoline-quinone synthase
MGDFFDRADAIRERWDVLRHPFYVRWSAGDLAAGELAFYAGQYRHAVVALADAADHAGDADHAAQERSHVALWDGFLDAFGGDAGAAPTSRTVACATAWADGTRDRAATLMALYAIEAAQPAISETKRAGLVRHYGIEAGSDATRYFDLHAVLDHDHAAHARTELEAIVQPADEDRLLAEAERVLQANWLLLDGVQERASAVA